MKHKVFVKNAAVMTVTSCLLRTIGIFFRIYLAGAIGAEGMGLYQLIISIYVLASTFATSGISTAVTRLVADELVCGTPRSVRRVLHRSVMCALLLGVLSAALVFFSAPLIGEYWIKDSRSVPALKMLAFGLPSMGVSGCLRGYFIARRRAADTSGTQLLEQAVRIGVVMTVLSRVAHRGLAASCFAVMLGDTVAEWAACLCLAVDCHFDRRRLKKELPPRVANTAPVVRRLLAIAAPITTGRYLNSLLRTVENLLVPHNIARYLGSKEQGLAQFGALKGMALPLIFFPASFLGALSTLLIPEISAANTLHQYHKINRAVERTLQLTLGASILIGTVFTVFSAPLGELLYHSHEVGIYLRVLAPLTPIMYLESMVDGILKGLNQQIHSLVYSVTDSALRIMLIVLVVPRFGMGGFLGVMVISNVLTSFLNVGRLMKVTGLRLRVTDWIVKPLFCALGGAAAGLFTFFALSGATPRILSAILGILCLCMTYLALLFATKTVRIASFKKVVS